MRKARNLLILSVVIIVLIGAYFGLKYQAEKNAAQTEENNLPEATIISQLPQEKIIKISLKSENATIVFQKNAEKWVVNDLPFEPNLNLVELIASNFANLEAVEVIDPNPRDLQQYGLAQPTVIAEAILSDNTTGTIKIGDPTPTDNNYYAMVAGDPKVYSISGPEGSRFKIGINDLRDKSLAQVNFEQLEYFKLVRANGKPIEITVNPNHAPSREDYGMSYWQISQPYADALGINMDRFNKEIIPQLQTLEINEYIEDRPQDLGKYGLSQPRYELIVKDIEGQTLHLQFGKDQNEDYIYCKSLNAPAVFTINKDILSILDLTPFQMVNKIAYLINIDTVDKIIVEVAGRKHTLTFSRKVKKARSKKETDETITSYRINGKTVAEPVFKTFYRSLIGVSFEADNPKTMSETAPEVKTTFYLNSGAVRQYRINYVSFNPDFYAIFRNGRSEFLTSKDQVKAMLKDLEAMAQGKLKARDI
ncbi:MAG TPA: DUF4340 domain-containing protein [Bacillota bacterium]|nr:DUF4340 domain-containing protein [Bacillota bacterium]